MERRGVCSAAGREELREPSGAGVLEGELRGVVERQLGVRVLRTEPISTGIGVRRFLRLHTAGSPATLVARIEAPEDPAGRPPGIPPEPALEPLRSLLEAHGLPVPGRLGGDAALGIDLLEDVGERSLEDLAARAGPSGRTALYREVLAWIPRLQTLPDPGGLPAFGRRLDRAHFRYKGALFTRFSLPAALGRPARPAEEERVGAAFECIADLLAGSPERLAHRDLQSRNVQVRGGGEAAPRLAMIDFQGAFLAPPEYDAVSLLRDSYVELADAEYEAHLDWLRPRLPDAPDRDTLRRRFDLLTLSRKGKDHARFLYAARERDDLRWLTYLPPTVRALRAAGARVAGLDPRLADLAALLERLPEAPCAR
jgi:N-acetylmuramate 1-kinase